jgi:hypothetical protein
MRVDGVSGRDQRGAGLGHRRRVTGCGGIGQRTTPTIRVRSVAQAGRGRRAAAGAGGGLLQTCVRANGEPQVSVRLPDGKVDP